MAGHGNDALIINPFLGGDSTLNGGAGADSLRHVDGGPGSSIVTFDYNAVSDSPAGAGRDKIINFTGVNGFDEEDENGDQIDLTTIDAKPSVAGNQAFVWGGPFTGRPPPVCRRGAAGQHSMGIQRRNLRFSSSALRCLSWVERAPTSYYKPHGRMESEVHILAEIIRSGDPTNKGDDDGNDYRHKQQ